MSSKKNKGGKKRNNFLNSTITVGAPNAKDAVEILKSMPKKEKQRFLDFVTTTTNINSGTQQYGAGQKLERSMRSNAIGGVSGGSAAIQVTTIPMRSEKVAEISLPATSGFKVERFQINAGLLQSFPWLNQIAQGYEKYRFKRIQARFVPKVGIYSDAAKVGNVLMSVDYDSVDPDPPGPDWMENTNPHTVCTASKPSSLKFNANGWRYVRAGNVPGGTDIRLYDVCTLFVATSDFTDVNTVIGKLYLDYEVEFAVPQQALSATDDKGVILPKPMERTFTCSCLKSTSAAGVTPGAYQSIQSWIVSTVMNALGISVSGGVSQQINFPRGNYIVRFDGYWDNATTSVGGILYPIMQTAAGTSNLRLAGSYAVGAAFQSINACWQVSFADEGSLTFVYKALCAAAPTTFNGEITITVC